MMAILEKTAAQDVVECMRSAYFAHYVLRSAYQVKVGGSKCIVHSLEILSEPGQ